MEAVLSTNPLCANPKPKIRSERWGLAGRGHKVAATKAEMLANLHLSFLTLPSHSYIFQLAPSPRAGRNLGLWLEFGADPRT